MKDLYEYCKLINLNQFEIRLVMLSKLAAPFPSEKEEYLLDNSYVLKNPASGDALYYGNRQITSSVDEAIRWAKSQHQGSHYHITPRGRWLLSSRAEDSLRVDAQYNSILRARAR